MIAKGAVEVSIMDTSKSESYEKRMLQSGEYFGEISMIYNCRRTA